MTHTQSKQSISIAITGKGGVGKTTVAAALVARLISKGHTPVLAVDADPNTCLDETLGVKAQKSVGGVREEAKIIAGKGGLGQGISKQELLELKIAESLVEADDFDLIAMGRPEGPGCYCYANNVLKQTLDQIANSYPYLVIDNEAGLENLSRRIVREVDLMIMVADPSKRGLDTVRRLFGLAREMEVKYKHLAVVVNRLRSDVVLEEAGVLEKELAADLCLTIRENEELENIAVCGGNLFELSSSNDIFQTIDSLIELAGVK